MAKDWSGLPDNALRRDASKLGADMRKEILDKLYELRPSDNDRGRHHFQRVADDIRAILTRQPAAIDKEPVAEVVMEPFDTWPRLKWVSVESMRNVEAGDMLYAAPLAQTALTDDAREMLWSIVRRLERGYRTETCARELRALLTAAQSASGADHAN